MLELVLDGCKCLADLLATCLVGRREYFEIRLVAAVQQRKELEILALTDRVEFVIVALAAADREAEPNCAGRVYAIDDRFNSELFQVDPAFLVDHRVAMESRGDELLCRRVRQQIAGQLLNREL